MIKILKNQADAKRVKDWDERVMLPVRSVLTVLDSEYGSNRNISKDLGGFVILCDKETTLDELEEVVNLCYCNYEWADLIEAYDDTYVMALYLLSSDYSVVTVTTKALFDELTATANEEWAI